MDAKRAKTLLRVLEKKIDRKHPYGSEFSDALSFAASYIIDNRWIPVTERLPEVPGRYMVTEVLIDGSRCISFADFGMVHTSSLFSFRKGRFEVAFGTDYFDDGERHDDEFYRQFSHTDIYDTKEVTAWKYIPKPYGGET